MSNLCVEGDEHMFRIAICDDERQFRKRIHDILIEYMNENNILYEIDEFESGKDFISLGINLAKYDIVFLNVINQHLYFSFIRNKCFFNKFIPCFWNFQLNTIVQ